MVITQYFETKVLFQRCWITKFLQDDTASVCCRAAGDSTYSECKDVRKSKDPGITQVIWLSYKAL